MPGVGIQVAITGDVSGLNGAVGEAKSGIGAMGGALNALPMVAVAGAALAVGSAIVDMTKAAAEDRAEQEKLLTTYQNVGVSLEEANAATQAAIDLGAEKAFSDSEVRAGLESLIVATGDADEANKALGQAMDIARAAGVPLEQAADAVAKAHAGQDAALRKLFPGMEKQASAADTITEATKLSTGAADEYASSAEGMGKKGQDAFGELGEQVGEVFLPILDALVPAIGPFMELLGELLKFILPPLKFMVERLVQQLNFMMDVIKLIAGWLETLIGWINKALDALGKFLDSINPLKGFELPSLPFMASTGFATGPQASTRSGGGSSGGGGNVVNVHVQSADPTEVVRAIRRWSRNNGGSGPFTRGLDRSTA